MLVVCEVTPEARQRLRRLETEYPYALDTCAPESVYGILILSRFPLTLRSSGIGEDPHPATSPPTSRSRVAASLLSRSTRPIQSASAGRIESLASSMPLLTCVAWRHRISS